MTRRKFTSKFKTKVVLELLKEHASLAELAQKYELAPQQLSNWKREFLNNAEEVFEKGPKSKQAQADEEKDKLLKTIGKLKVENDFLKDALR
ncbi:transposase [Mangrovivirga cuniculi]|uniref:Helix-turn-helix domain-containing protein n=1 Tax=Mangrovivirga cuniculi TaxID=2715131 RepID=A0A4D7JVI7_9BACT|nr:transposase [Mangrovivirga cuniculi]QCK14825.1 helix-turn-helix domain-containing protein [Mangrovivirga cuniculi]